MRLTLERISSPVSDFLIVVDEQGVMRALEFAVHEPRLHRLLRRHYGSYELDQGKMPESIKRPLEAYFDGDLTALDEIPVATGGTPFQRDVWKALREIPAGQTTSYGQLATKLGRAGASRAVGRANGSNPISLVVPCHRVIGADGTLTGYASGVANKRWLLEHETKFATTTQVVRRTA